MIVTKRPDAEMERSNASHKHFIDALSKAFKALGGESWKTRQTAENEKSDDMKDTEAIIFANKFSFLDLNEPKRDGEDTEDTSDEEVNEGSQAAAASQRHRPKKTPGKGKKGKRGKRAKRKQKPTAAVKEQSLDEVPLESYRIIQDEDGIITDYLLVVYAAFQEWMDLRSYVQGLWRDVAYCGLNSAIAGTVSNIAIAMVKRTESAIFVDFPGHDSYETIMNTITRGDPEKAQSNFSIGLHVMGPNSGKYENVQTTNLDVKEQYSIYAYQDLIDFITDFQRTRSGKPTKRLLAELNDWDPNVDLQRLSKEQRIRWRRSYTINWLYDLVNVFSSIVVQRNTLRGEHHAYERVDWSIYGPWNQHRRLFGLNEFAGLVTSLAMQKSGTDVRAKILPSHVFQLQCIVDSLTVSRGWSLSGLRGHVLKPPSTAFRPRRDVDLFLDREQKRAGSGYLQAVHVLKQLLDKDAMMHGDQNRHQRCSEVIGILQEDFRDWLGESKYMYGLNTIPPSRFSNSNTNGLWEYSPFLCGVGLMEGLELAFRTTMMLWDRIPEPMMLVHLHNMLVQKGYITKDVGLYASMETLFPTAFFADGKPPTSNFDKALLDQISETGSRRAVFRRRAVTRMAHSATDIHGLLNLEMNRFFKAKPNLLLYRLADWNPERIPDVDVSPESMLGLVRIAQTKQVIDPGTGETRLQDTDLVNRARANGMDENTLLNIPSRMRELSGDINFTPSPDQFASLPVPEGFRARPAPGTNRPHRKNEGEGLNMSARDILTFLKYDIFRDINGNLPLSSLNYVWVTIRFMLLFMQIEGELRRVRNPLWVRAYETELEWKRDKRVGLTFLALAEQDDECLRIMAKEFQNPRAGFMNHIYWEDLDETGKTMRGQDADAPSEPDCVVM